MTPEERKAIAAHRNAPSRLDWRYCDHNYPKCCAYHEGFDDALGLLVPTAASHLWSIKQPGQP